MDKKKKQLYKNDDWMEKELERENRTSAWDFDNEDKNKHVKTVSGQNADSYDFDIDEKQKGSQRADKWASVWFVIDFILGMALSVLNMYLENGSYLPPVTLFLMMNPGMFVWMFLFKRFMPAWYLILAAVIAIMLQIRVIKG